MSGPNLVILLVLAFAVLLSWLLVPRRNAPKPELLRVSLKAEELFPRHYLYFAQVRQALSIADQQYLREQAPSHVARKAVRVRHQVVRHYLSGLHEDFSDLESLARMVAALSPEISSQQETERLFLGLKFRLLYARVWLQLSIGHVPLEQLQDLTGLVGRLATRMEQAIDAVGALSAGELSSRLNA